VSGTGYVESPEGVFVCVHVHVHLVVGAHLKVSVPEHEWVGGDRDVVLAASEGRG